MGYMVEAEKTGDRLELQDEDWRFLLQLASTYSIIRRWAP